MALIEANGIIQYYDIQGEGPPLLLVAGMGGTANYWAEQVAFFSATHTVISYDQRGTGRSSHVRVESIDQLHEDLCALLDGLAIQTVDYLGHSTGGNIGQIMAIETPERLRKLIIYASTTHGDAYRAKVWKVRRSIMENQGAELYGDMTSPVSYTHLTLPTKRIV